MASIFANASITMEDLFFYEVTAGAYDSGYYPNASFVFNGITYRDLVEVDWGSGPYAHASLFGGTGIVLDPTGIVAGGTVTGYLVLSYNAGAWVPWWGIQSISVSAAQLYQAFLTPSTADDDAIVQSVLSGPDAISGSPYDDVLLAYAGGDMIAAGVGNDTLDGGAGDDTLTGGAGLDRFLVTAGADSIGDLGGGDSLLISPGATARITLAASWAAHLDSGNSGTAVLVTAGFGADLSSATGAQGWSASNAGFAAAVSLTGSAAADTLTGGFGNDTLDGGPGGSDILAGGAGNDVYVLRDAADLVQESAGDGTDLVKLGSGVAAYVLPENVELLSATDATGHLLTGNALANRITGGSGGDTLDGAGGGDTLIGGAGSDVYLLRQAGDLVQELANDGIDLVRLDAAVARYALPENVEQASVTDASAHFLVGNALGNLLAGADGNDTLVGLGGHDTLVGGAGDDWIVAHADDSVSGGSGSHDLLYMADDTPVSIALDTAGIEWMQSGFGNDTITAAGQTHTVEVYAMGGNDSVVGGSGDDWLWGSIGNDTLIGNAGSDIIVGDVGADSLAGGAGNDRIYIDTSDSVDGGDGFDAAYVIGGSGIALDLAATHLEWVTDFVNGNDTLDASGTSTGVEFYAGGGNDRLTGGSGNDLIFAGSGADTLTGGAGDDGLIGEEGADSIAGGEGNDRIYADVSDTVDGGAGYDIMYMVTDAAYTVDLGAIHVEWLFAGAGNDSISSSTATPIQVYANAGNDTLLGGGGNDTLWGGEGADSLAGGLGSDTLVGEAGNDTLAGGAGDDGLFGGAGADVFVLDAAWGSDTIFDWEDGTDRIDARPLAGLGLHDVTGLTITANGTNAVVSYAGNTLTILGAAGLINAADFLFA